MTMRAKLTWAVSALLACLLAAVTWFAVESYRRSLTDEVFRGQYTMLASVAEELDTRLATARMLLVAAADTLPGDLFDDPERLQAYLDARADMHRLFDNHVFAFSAEGRLLAEAPYAPELRGKDFSYREYIRATQASGQPYISDPFISRQAHGHPIIMMTAPVRAADGRLRGMLAASLDLMRDNFLGKLAVRKIGEAGYFYLGTRDRVLVMHPDKARIFKPMPQGIDPAFDAAIDGFQGTQETVNSLGRSAFESFKRMSQKDWIVAVNYPVDEAMAPLRRFAAGIVGLALVGLAASAWLIHVLMGRLLGPLRRLAEHMAALAGKQGAARQLALATDDEAGQLTRAFNAMIADADRQKLALAEQEALYRTVVRFATDFIYWRGPDGAMRYVSDNAERVTGHAAEAFIADPGLLDAIVHADDRPLWQRHVHHMHEGGEPEPIDFRVVLPGGETRWVSHLCQHVVDAQGRFDGIRGSHSDITGRKQSEARLRLAGAVFESAREAILVSDAENRILAINPAFTRMTGYAEAEMLGANPRILKSGETPLEHYIAMWRDLKLHGYWQGEFSNRRKDGTLYDVLAAISAVHDEAGALTHYVGIETDISDMKAAEARIEHLAYHDALTGLPNRMLLMERAGLALALSARRREQAAILFLDLDRFKDVNDSLGHAAGDALLIEAGRRLAEMVREADTVSRLGGDEFVLLLTGVAAHGAQEVADKVLGAMRRPFVIEGHHLRLSTSIGIALFPEDGADIGELLKNADAALYRAKQEGRNTLVFYNRDMNVATFEKLVLETELKTALERGELCAYYQPKVSLADGRLVGAEALVRWRHPVHGLIPPGQFIPVAETSGLIDEVCHWMLGEVCRQLAAWRDQGLPAVTVAVNLAPRNFRAATLPKDLRDLLQSYSLDARALEIELTESTLLDAGEPVLANLSAIKELGIVLAIDDFGTGYSSLGYLRRLPIGILKIDQSFVRDLESDIDDRTLAGSIIALGNSLGLGVVAEGVESVAQRDILIELGCRVGQGYLYSRPLPAEEFHAWVAAGGVPASST